MNALVKELADQVGLPMGNENPAWAYEQGIYKLAELIISQCGYYADIFSAAGCPEDMDPTETKPSDYIKRQMRIEE